MGGFVHDVYVSGLLEDLNLRFGPPDGIKEMAALQKEFQIFSDKHALSDAFALLNIGPLENWTVRRGWRRYLEELKKTPPNKSMTAHERLVSSLRDNLESKAPLPVFFATHSSTKNPDVIVKRGDKPLSYSTQEYLTISLPMTAVEKNRLRRRAKQ